MNKKTCHNNEKRLLSIDECCDYVGMGRNKTRALMHEIGADLKIGSRSLFDKKRIDEYIDSLISGRNEYNSNVVAHCATLDKEAII